MNINANIYANSLFSLADEENRTESVLESLSTTERLFAENSEYEKILDAPMIKLEERISLIDEAFSSLDEYVCNFLKILCEKKSVYILSDCLKQFIRLYNKKNNIENVTVITAAPISEDIKARLHEKLEKDFGKRVVEAYKVDASILGGIIVRTEHSQTDASVLSRLEDLKKQLALGALD